MVHLKRQKMSKTWPIVRKGTKFVARASHANKNSIPLLFVLRDILGIGKTRKEVKRIVLQGDVKINNKIKKDEVFPIQIFDVISLEKIKKNYRLEIVNRKYELKEIDAKEAGKKIVKIGGKKILGKDKVQMNLEDGGNFLTKEKFSVGDSVVLNTKEDKIEKVLSMKEGANIEVISGKHAGEKGKIKTIRAIGNSKLYLIKLEGKEVEIPGKTLIVIE